LSGGAHPHDEGTASGAPDVNDYLPDADLAQLSKASELVIFGSVIKAQSGVLIAEDKTAEYTVYTVEVKETLRGTAAKTVDVALLTHLSKTEVRFESRPTPQIGDQAVWLLNPIAPEFKREGYVLTNLNSLIVAAANGSRLIGAPASSPAGKDIHKLGNLDALLAHLRAV
jgi:hypothetical protein